MGGVEGGSHLLDDGQSFGGGNATPALEEVRQGLSFQEFHGEEGDGSHATTHHRIRRRLMLAEVKDAANVRVGDGAGEGDLPLEALERGDLSGAEAAGRDGLEGHPLA